MVDDLAAQGANAFCAPPRLVAIAGPQARPPSTG